jgi:hypothetical protein
MGFKAELRYSELVGGERIRMFRFVLVQASEAKKRSPRPLAGKFDGVHGTSDTSHASYVSTETVLRV